MSDETRERAWITMKDVARQAGVSVMTVSRSFSSPNRVNAETRARVLKSAVALDYFPNLVAGNLSSGRSRTVAAVVPSIRNSNFSTFVEGLGDALSAANFHLILAVAPTPARELEVVRALIGRRPEGIALTGTHHRRETVRLLKAARLAVVETWELGGPFVDSAVGFDAYDAARSMTGLLIRKGHRRIGYADFDIRGEKRFSERRRGFQDAMKTAGLRSDLIATVTEASGFAAGRHALEQLFAIEAELQAIFCVTDVVAAGVMFECARRRWSIPQQLAVAGFGDFQISRELAPTLTTIQTRGHDIGRVAGKLLTQRLEGGLYENRIEDVGFELVEREST